MRGPLGLAQPLSAGPKCTHSRHPATADSSQTRVFVEQNLQVLLLIKNTTFKNME